MSDQEEPHSEKKVTPATIDAPQEEFISPKSVPSEPEKQAGREREDRMK